MEKLRIRQKVIGMVSTNVYLAVNTQTKEGFLVDPADRGDFIEEWIKREEVNLKGILLTHGHFDHIGAVNELKKSLQVPVYAMGAEAVVLQDSNLNLSSGWKEPFVVKADRLLENEEVFELAGFSIRAYHTPGHTRGGACYYLEAEKTLFSGDTIFCEEIGRTDLPTGNYRELVDSVKGIIARIPEDTVIYPGHEESTTAAHEKKYNPYV